MAGVSRAVAGPWQGLAGPRQGSAEVSRGRQGSAGPGLEASLHGIPPLTCTLCRPAAHAVLTGLRARRWVDQHTRAMSVHFVLYNPPTRLFSGVSLHAELLPAGGLTTSLLVESVPIFHSDSAPRYHLLIPQVSSPATRPPRALHQTPAMPAGCGHRTGRPPRGTSQSEWLVQMQSSRGTDAMWGAWD